MFTCWLCYDRMLLHCYYLSEFCTIYFTCTFLCATMWIKYSRDMLMNLRKGVINNPLHRIVSQTWDKLRDLKILANATKRGCRAGISKKQRSIPVHLSHRSGYSDSRRFARREVCRPIGVNRQNLINIKRTKLQSHNAQRIRFGHWNARSLNAKNKSGLKSAALCDFVIDNQLDL